MGIIMAALLFVAEPAPDGRGTVQCTILPDGMEFCVEELDGPDTFGPERKQCDHHKGIWMCEA